MWSDGWMGLIACMAWFIGVWMGGKSEASMVEGFATGSRAHDLAEEIQLFHRQACETPETCRCEALALEVKRFGDMTALWHPHRPPHRHTGWAGVWARFRLWRYR
jgi:hypothetical protein